MTVDRDLRSLEYIIRINKDELHKAFYSDEELDNFLRELSINTVGKDFNENRRINMIITILTKKDSQTIQIHNIKTISETDDGMIIFSPEHERAPIFINGELIMYSELPTIDKRMIHSLNINL